MAKKKTSGSTDEASHNYEVGYGKPPKKTQFKKGFSGNPSGRSRRPLDFDAELIREAKSLITVHEKGRRRRISKHAALLKQLMNDAMKGSVSDRRMYFKASRTSFGKAALLEAQQPVDLAKCNDPKQLTEEQLLMIAFAGLEDAEQKLKELRDKGYGPMLNPPVMRHLLGLSPTFGEERLLVAGDGPAFIVTNPDLQT